MKILVIDNYDSYSCLLSHLIWNVTKIKPDIAKNDDPWLTTDGWKNYDFLIISPGPGSVENPFDFGECLRILTENKNSLQIPTLGVCLGLQGIGLLAQAKICSSPDILHGKTSIIKHQGSEIFKNIPDSFLAVRYHSLVLDPSSINLQIKVLAKSQKDQQIMAIKLTDAPFYGVQFHPESIKTQYGETLISNFFELHPPKQKKANQIFKTPPVFIPKKILYSFQFPVLKFQKLKWHENEETLWKYIASKYTYAFWLDSNSKKEIINENRWSYMGVSDTIWQWKDNQVNLIQKKSNWGKTSLPNSLSVEDFLSSVQTEQKSLSQNLPFPLHGGVVGFIDYASNLKELNEKQQSLWMHATEFFVWDHQEKHFFYAYSYPEKKLLPLLKNLKTSFSKNHSLNFQNTKSSQEYFKENLEKDPKLITAFSKQKYHQRFKKIQELLEKGELYQLCLSNQFTYDLNDLNSVQYYFNLRKEISAPFSAYLKTPQFDFLSMSPELFLETDGFSQTIYTHPMKGSRSVCKTKNFKEQEKSFKESAKENAELLMITDLLRNDCSYVCKPNSIHAKKSLSQWANVLQLSTKIHGTLLPDIKLNNILSAFFPGGSITGAPKIRATQWIKELENFKRNHFTGNIGFVSLNGTTKLSIAIRSILINQKKATLGAGGAITIDSNFEQEWQEIWLKASPLIKVLKQTLLNSSSND